MDPKTTGVFISKLRKEKGLTQKQMAEKLNVSDKAVSRWETGKGYPDIETLSAISGVFDISINELLLGERFVSEDQNQRSELDIAEAYIASERSRFKQNNIFFFVLVPLICIVVIYLAFMTYGVFRILFLPEYPSEWNSVQVTDDISMAVPQDWIMTKSDGIIYFSDKPLDDETCTVYLFQSFSEAGDKSALSYLNESEVMGDEESNALCKSFIPLYKNMASEGFSNGSQVLSALCLVDGNRETMQYITYREGDNSIILYVWGNNVDYQTLSMIAKSLGGYEGENMGIIDTIKATFEFGKSISDQDKKEQEYLSMSVDELSSLSDEELLQALNCRIEQKVFSFDDRAEGLASINEKQRILFSVNYYDMEMLNGGLCQYFVNTSRMTAPYISGYLSEIGAQEHKALFDSFISENNIDLSDLSGFAVDDVSEYQEKYLSYPFEKFDDAYYDLPSLETYMTKYARSNLEELA